MDTLKAHSKSLRLHNRSEINGHEDSIFVVVIFVPRRLTPIALKPLTYGGHRKKKLSGAYADCDAVHDPLAKCVRM